MIARSGASTVVPCAMWRSAASRGWRGSAGAAPVTDRPPCPVAAVRTGGQLPSCPAMTVLGAENDGTEGPRVGSHCENPPLPADGKGGIMQAIEEL